MQLVPRIAELGFFGSTLPEEYGCAGVSNVAYGLIAQELERGDSGLRSFASVQSSLVMYPIFTYGSEEQRKEWLPRMARGTAIGCFGLTEPDFGSNPTGMRTSAKAERGGYVLNGVKRWITNGHIADVAVVWARLEDKIHGFLVEKDRPGFKAEEMHGKLSLRASFTSELYFDELLDPRGEPPAGQRLDEGAALVPVERALRHLVGRARRRDGLLRLRAQVRAGSRDVLASDRGLPAGAGEAGRDGRRDHQGRSCSRCASGASRTPARCDPSRSASPR